MGTITEDDRDQHTGVHAPGSGVNPGQEHYNAEFNRLVDHPDNQALGRHALRHAEDDATESSGDATSSGGTSAKAAGDGDFSRDEEQGDKSAPQPQTRRQRVLGAPQRFKNAFSGKKNRMRRRALAIAAGLGAVLAPIFIFLALFLLALKVPHFVANVAAWQFVKVTRIASASNENVINEALGLQAAPDGWLERWRQRTSNMKDATARNLERLSASLVVRNMDRKGYLDTIEVKRDGQLGKLGLKRLKAVRVYDRSVLAPKSMYSYTDKFVHPFNAFKERTAFYNAVDDAVNSYNPHLNTYIRGKATLKIITQQIGAEGFKGIRMASFFGKSKTDAAVEAQKEVFEVAHPKPSVPKSAPAEVEKATQEVVNKTEACVKDPKCAPDTVTPDGIPPAAADAVDKAFTESAATAALKGVLGVLNPIYQVAVPVCLVYSGSVFDPNASNEQSDAIQREAAQMFAVDGIIKRGVRSSAVLKDGKIDTSTPTQEDLDYSANGDGVGAISGKLDGQDGKGIINSNAMLRADGQYPNTLTTGTSTQMTALGGYGKTTIFDILLGRTVAGPLNGAADTFCPVATNIWVGVGVAAANLIALGGTAFFTAGSGAVAEYGSEAGAEIAAQSGMRIFIDTIMGGFTSREGAVSLFSKSGRFGYQFGKKITRDTVIILGTVYLAKLLTFYNAGSFHNGLPTGVMYANDIDNGANQLGNTTCRNVYYGRFLTYAETAQSDQDDITTRFQTAARQSTYTRYLALSNPDSMLTKFGQTTVMRLNHNTPRNILASMGSIFNPAAFFTKAFGSLTSKASAAANVETENYGNIQCGYTREEMRKIKPVANEDVSYQVPSQNASILEESGRYEDIDNEYGPCFTQKIGTLMTTEDNSGRTYLVRTDKGDLSSESVCSPQNLSLNNPQYGDLVFRYRLEHMYDNNIHGLYGVQTAGANELGNADGNTAQPATAGGGI